MPEKVLVAMSGGVDSSVACHLLKEHGYSCVGATIKTWQKEDCERSGEKICCSFESIGFARDAASRLNIPHYVFDFSKEFSIKIKDYFTNEYLKGRTPNPCVLCNSEIKFGLLLKKADELGCKYIASGHYARVEKNKDCSQTMLKKGKDKIKDQSYFLFKLRQDQLSRILFPLGCLTKEEVRDISKRLGQKSFYSQSSQDICFTRPKVAPKKGNIVLKGGKTIGSHRGYFNYTLGQRKGLGVAYSEPLYVTGIDARNNTVEVGIKTDVLKRVFIADGLNWIQDVKLPFKCKAKIRYGQKESDAFVFQVSKNNVRVKFLKPQYAPTPGQAVFLQPRQAIRHF